MLIFLAVFSATVLLHWPLLHLPYYWDEAGYYIPAAYDFFRTGALIPYSTLTNAHPPMPSFYLAWCWKLFGFSPLVTRVSVCAVASLMLTGVWRLSLRASGQKGVAAGTVFLTALYPIVFVQSSLAHADIFAAAGTIWGIALLLDRTGKSDWLAALCFSVAALSKETAVVTPLALAVWAAFGEPRLQHQARSWARAAKLLLPILPLVCWYAYHHHRTGFLFGNPEYLRYNAETTHQPLRIVLALAHRLLHVTAHMNLFVPVLLMAACLLLAPLEDQDGAVRRRIAVPDLALFLVVLTTNVLLFSLVGGALLTRYLLPLYPLVLLLCVSTFRQRLQMWPSLVLLSAAGFVAGLFVNPPYRFAPEDNLAYRDVILLHQHAIAQIVTHYSHDVILTAWPATDELSKPELGYVQQPVPVKAVDNFSYGQLQAAEQEPGDYSAALLFSTKYDPPRLPLSLGPANERLDQRFFDFHIDLTPRAAAHLLDGQIVWQEQRKGQWAAVLTFRRAIDAELDVSR
ncbi:glycosyltransferase [Silvibacterium dinghuense]|uniref:Glycosyltransferase n=1 Tax=Silvibacterium dinghuense TaxID=1560006 RepID=A0A4V1NV61_9BACT|nr:glycosyltransferase [Silvibacterium dinghuense]